ncbi:MAG: hypothetical protein VKK04_04650 [Synechococcales bacterium]|nr:hypothetical protein [Synechococcales bacterium]
MLSAQTVRRVWQPLALTLAIGGAIASTTVVLFPSAAQAAARSTPVASGPPTLTPPAAEPFPADESLGRSPSPWLWPELFLPDFPSFDSQRLDEQLALYSLYLATVGTPDVLIVGSSRSLQGIDPTELQQALVEQGYPELNIYNFGINGATAQVIDLVIRQVLTPAQLPDLIIWADGSRAFNSGRSDATYDQITASAGYQQLQAGHHPIASASHPLAAPLQEICLNPPPSAHAASTADPLESWILAIADLLKLPTLGMELASHLFRGQLQHTVPCTPGMLSPEDSVAEGAPPPQVGSAANRSHGGAGEAGVTALEIVRSRITRDLNHLGFLAVGDRFDPSRYYQTHPVVPGEYDGAYVPFQLEGAQTAAALRLATYARQQQIPLAFVNLPLTNSYLDTFRQRHEQQFQRHMQALAAQGGFLFVDFSQMGLNVDAYFADPSHLNHTGARAIARHLATVSQIPWQPR